jgi:hypothetical protein
VFVTYFDEIKPNPKYKQPDFWLGAVSVPMDHVPAIERHVNAIATSTFGSADLTKETELHSVEIYFRNGNFQSQLDVGKRLNTFESLFGIFDTFSQMRKTFVQIKPDNIRYSSRSPERIAFMYLCEQIDNLMMRLGSHTLLIGDRDEVRTNLAVQEFLTYRTYGTNWGRGKDLERVIDSLYFAESHHSRMLQLADVYVFAMRVSWGPPLTGKMCSDLKALINRSSIDKHDACRIWPNEPVWYQLPG